MNQAEATKKRTTIYLSSEVLEFLKIRSAKGQGSVSRQLEDLARDLMPATFMPEEVEQLERRHARGYAQQPVGAEEFADFYPEQVLGTP